MVFLSIRWSGSDRSGHAPSTTPAVYHLKYRVQNGRIVEIWTSKINYTFIFGWWLRYSVLYRLFLGWAVVYFALRSLRREDLLADRG